MDLLLNNIKETLPELTNKIDTKTLSRVDEYFTKLENDLKVQKKILQENIQNEINKGIEMEYEIPKHTLIDDSVNYIQLKKELYTIKETIPNFHFMDQSGFQPSYSKNIAEFQRHFSTHKCFRLFKTAVQLPKNEFITYIVFKLLPSNQQIQNSGAPITYIFNWVVKINFITNYGRCIVQQYNIYNQVYRHNYFEYIINDTTDTINMSEIKEQHPLTYKMPVIFIKIIDAIYTENTSLLQECCEEYHNRYIENKKLKEENKIILETIKHPYDEMKPKYEMLIEENKRLKKEIELMKIEMNEIHKLYRS